ncbi:MAG: exonuclease [Curvibacter sp. PD_MW3]|nr:MAG: exonuclease [Curvibacter sp. PD_MW3]
MNTIALTARFPFVLDPALYPTLDCWLAPEQGWLARIAAHLRARGAHPARTVVLLPYAQLMPLAARLWAQAHPDGFAPRFETTQNWSRSLGGFTPAATDITFDAALDVLTARAMLERTSLGAQADAATPLLLEAAQQLGALAAAVPPSERAAWGARARSAAATGMDVGALALEAAVAQLAVAWAANSSYASDVLFEPRVIEATDCLIVLQGFQPDPLPAALQAVWGERMAVMALDGVLAQAGVAPAFHKTRDAQDEAQRAAACVLQHVNAGRTPVALVAIDRALTRRVRAMLASRDLQIRDETGWKLSTSRAGAHVMGALRACAWNVASDAVLDWLKNAPAFESTAVRQLEAQLRRQPLREWRGVPGALGASEQPALAALLADLEALRDGLQRPRTLPQWLLALRELLQRSGQWALLQDDVAGDTVLATLRLSEAGIALPADALWAQRRLSLTDFTRWVDQALEAASFTPEYPPQEQVVILPLAQLLGRPFGAVVLPGCDEVRLNPSPEPPGLWTAAQRAALGLPAREALKAALRAAWQHALCTPQVDLLWRAGDDGGEPLLPSPLVQALHLQVGDGQAPDPRVQREVVPVPVARPMPAAPQLDVARLSASAYSDLRHCPYRFFALRQLGLKEAEELEVELDKRDFGLWLHAVLQAFHEQLKTTPQADVVARRALIDAAATQVTESMRLAEEEFLPFQAAWPRVREGYLEWLAGHETEGLHFEEGERWQEQPLGSFTLVGRLDRIDQAGSGEVMVIDYKTESPTVTAKRIKEPFEDTQLAFYAALQPHDTLRAAYVNISEKEGSKTFEQKDVVAVRDALIEGIAHDLQRIAEGAPLPALGEGDACEFCAARGLCRKDFWADDSVGQEEPL